VDADLFRAAKRRRGAGGRGADGCHRLEASPVFAMDVRYLRGMDRVCVLFEPCHFLDELTGIPLLK